MPFAELPMELVKAVGNKLDRKDLCSLRLVSRALAVKSLDSYKTLFKKKWICLTKPSLEALLALSKHKTFSACVQELNIEPMRFTEDGLRAGVSHKTIGVPYNINPVGPAYGSGADEHYGLTMDQFRAYGEYTKAQLWMEKKKHDIQFLAKALTKMTGIQSVTVGYSFSLWDDLSQLPRACCMLGFTSVLNAIGHDNQALFCPLLTAPNAYERSCTRVMEAILDSKASISRFSIWDDTSCNHSHWSNLSSAPEHRVPIPKRLLSKSGSFTTVKAIKMQILSSTFTINPYLPDDRGRPLRRHVCESQLLLQFPNVETLHLGAARDHETFGGFSKMFHLRHLTKLTLTGFDCHSHVLEFFLRIHASTLEDITFDEVVLRDSTWHELAPVVSVLHRLQRLELRRPPEDEEPEMPADILAGLNAAVANAFPGNGNAPHYHGAIGFAIPFPPPNAQGPQTNGTGPSQGPPPPPPPPPPAGGTAAHAANGTTNGHPAGGAFNFLPPWMHAAPEPTPWPEDIVVLEAPDVASKLADLPI